jgi:decaprenyl-phosphate phosphoribosyltransferase
VYVALTTTYSAIWKHIAVVDLIAVAAGFVVRAIAGAAATGVPMSSWFVLVTSFGALFIVTGKRYAELREHGDAPSAARATLDDYTLGFLRIVLSVSCGATLVAYCIWAFEASTAADSSLPMLTALLRYLLILEQGHGAAPEEIFIADRTLQIIGLIWVAVFLTGVYVS